MVAEEMRTRRKTSYWKKLFSLAAIRLMPFPNIGVIDDDKSRPYFPIQMYYFSMK